jgi:hypothetical protein
MLSLLHREEQALSRNNTMLAEEPRLYFSTKTRSSALLFPRFSPIDAFLESTPHNPRLKADLLSWVVRNSAPRLESRVQSQSALSHVVSMSCNTHSASKYAHSGSSRSRPEIDGCPATCSFQNPRARPPTQAPRR